MCRSDAQCYHVARDSTGRGFLRALRDAAARTVRLRLLVDDLCTTGLDELLAALGVHQNVEMRLFNPFASRATEVAARFAASMPDFNRLQRRMHNKLLVADGAFAITGGGNIADEYYWQSEASAFFDLDVLLAEPVIADMAAQFDVFWNSKQAWPVQALHPASSSPDALRSRFKAEFSNARLLSPPPLATDLLSNGRLADELRPGRVA